MPCNMFVAVIVCLAWWWIGKPCENYRVTISETGPQKYCMY